MNTGGSEDLFQNIVAAQAAQAHLAANAYFPGVSPYVFSGGQMVGILPSSHHNPRAPAGLIIPAGYRAPLPGQGSKPPSAGQLLLPHQPGMPNGSHMQTCFLPSGTSPATTMPFAHSGQLIIRTAHGNYLMPAVGHAALGGFTVQGVSMPDFSLLPQVSTVAASAQSMAVCSESMATCASSIGIAGGAQCSISNGYTSLMVPPVPYPPGGAMMAPSSTATSASSSHQHYSAATPSKLLPKLTPKLPNGANEFSPTRQGVIVALGAPAATSGSNLTSTARTTSTYQKIAPALPGMPRLAPGFVDSTVAAAMGGRVLSPSPPPAEPSGTKDSNLGRSVFGHVACAMSPNSWSNSVAPVPPRVPNVERPKAGRPRANSTGKRSGGSVKVEIVNPSSARSIASDIDVPKQLIGAPNVVLSARDAPRKCSQPFSTDDSEPDNKTGDEEQQRAGGANESNAGNNNLNEQQDDDQPNDFSLLNDSWEAHGMLLHQYEMEPHVLNHLIDGFVIQESAQQFPVSPFPFEDFVSESAFEWSQPPDLEPEAGDVDALQDGGPSESRSSPWSDSNESVTDTVENQRKRLSPELATPDGPPKLSKFEEETPTTADTPVLMDDLKVEPLDGSSPSDTSESPALPSLLLDPQNQLKSDRCRSTEVPDVAFDPMIKLLDQWSTEDVCQFIMTIQLTETTKRECCQKFVDEDIDGAALMLMLRGENGMDRLSKQMNLKLGPALKISYGIDAILKRQQAASENS